MGGEREGEREKTICAAKREIVVGLYIKNRQYTQYLLFIYPIVRDLRCLS